MCSRDKAVWVSVFGWEGLGFWGSRRGRLGYWDRWREGLGVFFECLFRRVRDVFRF